MTGQELKQKRESLKITQAKLAELLDVKQNTVYRWEAGILPITRTVELAIERIEIKLKDEK